MDIYFITHSTSVDNEAKKASGWSDAPLSDLGKKQAAEVPERLKGIDINLIVTSDLSRALETVNIAFGNTIPVISDKRLRELNYGDFDGKPTNIVNPMKKNCIETPFPNGESCIDANKRIHDFLHELKEKHDDKTILIVGHRATQYGLDTLVHKKTFGELLSIPFEWQPYWKYVW